ncbi:TonB-dependent receptor [uncultured Parabacteroides sp.]|uniref:SusC/RagA family TonB-linked outer membrane protein n=1 Tax=uncultured Parabacteroides sp. TaxID=512312 RepID=UPI00265842DF|nr:TonB-dependent receptor [uncultured Parabacteroides sp.]
MAYVPSSAKTLVVSFVGMKTQEVGVKPNLRLVLESDNQMIDEVVVVAYGTAKKAAFTGSAGVVKTEQIEKRQVSDVTNALAGVVAGVQIQSANGQPGTSATVKIRGVGSINAESDPLYVVDGIPYDGDISSINSQDIESMTVLKDAASTALYGARGANGVIMITTKKGKSGKASINFDAKWGVNSRMIKNYDVMTDVTDYMDHAYQALYNAGIYNLGYDATNANSYANTYLPIKSKGGLGYQIFTVPDGESLYGLDGKMNPNAKLGYTDGTYYYTPDNWSNEIFSNKARQEYNLNVSGSSEKANYYVSFGYLDDQGIIDGSGFTRYSTRAKGDYQVKEWLKVGANLSYTYSNSRYPGDQTATASSGNAFLMANMIAPIYPLYVRNADGSIKMNRGRKVYDYGDGVSTKFSRSFMSISNPAGDLIYNKDEYLHDIVNANWYADFTPIEGLKITARYGMNLDSERYNLLGNAYSGQSASYGGTAYQGHSRTWGFDQQYIATYQKTFNDDHNFDVMIGYDGYKWNEEVIEASGQNLYNPENFHVNNAIDQLIGYGYGNSYATEGYIARANYDYQNTYYVSASFRRDGSSRFHPDHRWGNCWSASAAWILSKESFLEDVKWIDLLKFKASFGQQGNDMIGNYYAYIDQFKMTGANGIFSDGALDYKGNPDLTWETSTSFNTGFDFSMFNNRFNGSIEYFLRQSSDMLYYKPVGPISGYQEIPMNVGSMRNSGLELDFSYAIIKNKDISWDVNLNASFIKNEIIELHPDLNGELINNTRIYTEGESMYRMYLVKYAGVDPETGMALYWAKDKDGNPITTSDYSNAVNYKEATDDLLPTVYGGFGTSLSLYGFDASVQLSYQLGGKIYDSGYARFMHGGSSSYAGTNWHKDIYNAWTETNRNTDVPRLDSEDKYASSQSDRWLTNSNYLSLNNITIGYTLPKSLTTKFLVDRLRVYFAADNVALLSARKGLDPRQSYTSATTALYTPIRTVSGGISVTF